MQRLAIAVHVSGELAFLVLIWVALPSLAFSPRATAYIAIAGLTTHYCARQLAIPVFANTEGDLDALTRAERGSLLAAACGHLAIATGIAGGLLGWQGGARLALAGLTAVVAAHFLVGASAYRRVMARAWPDVPPLEDEDWA